MKDDQIYDTLFNLKFTSKRLLKGAKESEKGSEKEKLKIKKALEAGNADAARIYAENSIRKHNEGIDYLRLASRVDGVVSRLQSAIQIKDTARLMKNTVKGMDKILNSLDPVKITKLMDEFEKQSDTLQVNVGTMDAAFQSTSANVIPIDQVDTLMEQIATENNLDIRAKLNVGPLDSKLQATTSQLSVEDDISQRLRALQSLGG